MISKMAIRLENVAASSTETNICEDSSSSSADVSCLGAGASGVEVVVVADSGQEDVDKVSITSATMVCRICQLSQAESGEVLEETGCACKGGIQLCHRNCIQTWISTRRSKICEVCNDPMNYEVIFDASPVSNLENSQLPRNIQMPVGGVTHCKERRSWFITIVIMLILASCSAMATSIYTQRDFRNAEDYAKDHFEILPPKIQEKFHYAVRLSMSLAVFCGVITVSLSLLWVAYELVIAPEEIRLRRLSEDWTYIFPAVNQHERDMTDLDTDSSSSPSSDIIFQESIV